MSVINIFKIVAAKISSFFSIYLLAILLGAGIAIANPVLDNVAAGDVNVQQTAATTQVNQNSQQAIINWQSFNIGAGEKTQFVQPNASAIALNRINPNQGVSQIYGQLTANGRIILVNQAGVFFGPTARVDVAGIIVSTSNISNENFLNGRYYFDQAGNAAAIINRGTISAADYGLVALIGTSVSNTGLIQARLGNVILGSGNKFILDFSGDQLISFSIDEGTASNGIDYEGHVLRDRVSNSGTIMADGGTVILSAKAAGAILDHVINMAGVIEARSVAQSHGSVILSSGSNGIVRVAGRINVSGKAVGEKGGSVKVTGQYLLVDNGAIIDASGDIGGGQILVGGNAQGAGPEMNALYTYIGKDVKFSADALTKGNGGTVVAWSDLGTWVYGSISARGGAQGGNGGFVETSGKFLDVNGSQVVTAAINGDAGTWLLDPTNIYIADDLASALAAGMTGSNTSANSFSGSFPQTAAAAGAVQDSLLTVATLTAALTNGSGNVIVTTTNGAGTGLGNITVVNGFTTGSTSLTLNADNNININAQISVGAGDLILNAPGTIHFSVMPTFQNLSQSMVVSNGVTQNYMDFGWSHNSSLVTAQELNQINQVVVAANMVEDNVLGTINTNGENALMVATRATDFPGMLPQAIPAALNADELAEQAQKTTPKQAVAENKVIHSRCVGDICIDD